MVVFFFWRGVEALEGAAVAAGFCTVAPFLCTVEEDLVSRWWGLVSGAYCMLVGIGCENIS